MVLKNDFGFRPGFEIWFDVKTSRPEEGRGQNGKTIIFCW